MRRRRRWGRRACRGARTARAGHEVLLIEAAEAIGMGISSRNSEVIHAGIYYPPGSLKAQLCVEGRHQLYTFVKATASPPAGSAS